MRTSLGLWAIKSYSNGNKGGKKVDHGYSISGWDFSVMTAVRENVVDCMTGVHRVDI